MDSPIPNLRSQSLAVDFIDNRLDKYHPAFATPLARYDPALGGFVVVPSPREAPAAAPAGNTSAMGPKREGIELTVSLPRESGSVSGDNTRLSPRPLAEPTEALKFWDAIFAPAMHQFQASTREPNGRREAGFSIRDAHDWTAVFDQLDAAKEHYFAKAKIKGSVRYVYRKLADNMAPVLLSVTNLAPQTDCMFVTPVLGSIQIVLEAVKKAAEIRKVIEGSFDDLDFMFSEIELYLQTYPDDKNIETASTDIVVAVFAAIESVVGFLTKSILKRIGGAILKRGDYEAQVLEALDSVKSRSLRLLRESEGAEKWMLSEGMKRILAETGQIRQDLKDGFKSIIEPIIKELDAKLEAKMEAWNQECAALLTVIQGLSQPPSPNRLPEKAGLEDQKHISLQDLLDWIDVPDVAAGDMRHIKETRHRWVTPREQARAEQLVQSRQLREWMASTESSQLLVHGDYEGQRSVSGLTLFCSSLLETLALRAPRFVPLVYFCGMHTDRRADAYTGGRAIIQSFICQLLCQVEDANDLDITHSLADQGFDETLIRIGDVEELCCVFAWLVGRLPSGVVVFCLLDGIVYYERNELEQDMAVVLVTLLRVSDESNTRAAVKVLLTSPSRTVSIRQPFPDHLVLSMEAMAPLDQVASDWRTKRQLEEIPGGNS
ncbi:hypothetical protein QBC44DRAFT_352083 [Cladorrhinum sp. PSN332]|nr:hypothetical protein QBC44DRAFT_352083 [Cladorrhinum sp. PSN332]